MLGFLLLHNLVSFSVPDPGVFLLFYQRLEENSGKKFQSETLISENVFFFKRPLIRIYGFTV